MSRYLENHYEFETQRQPVNDATAPYEFSVGILKGNTLAADRSVTILPDTVETLVENHVAVYMERGLGTGAGITDLNYADAGADIEDETHSVYRKSTVLIRLAPFSPKEVEQLQEGQVIVSPVSTEELTPGQLAILQIKNITALSLKLVKNVENGELLYDILHVSEGNMAASAALGDLILSLIFPLIRHNDLHSALRANPALADALYCYRGTLTHPEWDAD